MKHLWLTAKISVLFACLLVVVLVAISMLFMKVAGHDLIDELARLRALEGVTIAEGVEALLEQGHGLGDPEIARWLDVSAPRHGLTLSLRESPPPRSSIEPRRPRHHLEDHHTRHHRHSSDDSHHSHAELRARSGHHDTVAPSEKLWIPIYDPRVDESDPLAYLVAHGPGHAGRIHTAFGHGLLLIAVLSLPAVILSARFLVAPLGRMERSMDRIADGDLDHRVIARGGDEVAAMGRSFNRMADRIQAMVQGQKELLAAVSHELRSPMTRMKMTLELLRASDIEPKRIADLDTEIDHLDALVGELLTASRYELATDELRPEPMDLKAVVDGAWQRTCPPDRAAGDWTDAIEPDARSLVADPALVERIFDNLFNNIRAYADPSTVTVRAYRRHGRVHIRVEDRGPGVDEEHRSKLFEPFYRADRSRSLDHGHVGLGLMVVQRAVAALGGSILAEHNHPHGLILSFDLPAAV